MAQFTKSYVSILGLRIVEKLMGFATLTVLFRYLSVEDVATYNYLLSVVAAMAIFGLPEMNNAISQSVARGCNGIYRPAIRIAALTSCLGTLAALGLAIYYMQTQAATQNALGLAVVAILFPMVSGLAHWRGYLVGKAAFTSFALFEGLTALLRATTLIALVLLGATENVVLLVLVALLFPSVLNVAMTLRYRAQNRNATEVEPGSLRYGLYSSFYAGVAQLAQHIEKLLLFNISPFTMAIFVAGERGAALMQALTQDLAAILAPYFARRKHFDRQLDTMLLWVSVAMGAICLLISGLAFPVLIPWAFGSTYAESVWIAQILTLAAVLIFHASFRFRYVKSKLDLKNYRNVTLIGPALRILVAVPLVYTFGLVGAVISVFIGNLVIVVMTAQAIRDHSK